MHDLQGFKGFKYAKIDLSRSMTILVGRNGAGKSNLVEAVELLAELANGRPLHEITEIGRGSGNSFEIRGGLSGCMRKESEKEYYPFVLSFSHIDLEAQSKIQYSIKVDFIPPRILEEQLWRDETEYFNAKIQKGSQDILEVRCETFSDSGSKLVKPLVANCSVLSRYGSIVTALYGESVNEKGLNEASKIAIRVKKHLKSAYVFDFYPRLMRQYESISAYILNKQGSNLSAVLYSIKQNDDKAKESERLLPRILAILKQLPEEPYVDFEFFTTPTNHVLFALKREDGTFIDASLLSDGTLRALAILVALETVPEGSRVIIEELDNGIHPSRAKLLIDTVWECSHRRQLNALVTTHNPATLNNLSKEQLDCVEVCHYNAEEKADQITPLSKIPFSDILLQQGQLGDLMTKNVLESYLMPHFEEDQQKKAESWLELF
ncbi:MAG: AAA family ATPase [Methyloprofundus sp.]|nr:AAA family ATPase [Methyloprofundus sp.]